MDKQKFNCPSFNCGVIACWGKCYSNQFCGQLRTHGPFLCNRRLICQIIIVMWCIVRAHSASRQAVKLNGWWNLIILHWLYNSDLVSIWALQLLFSVFDSELLNLCFTKNLDEIKFSWTAQPELTRPQTMPSVALTHRIYLLNRDRGKEKASMTH